MIPTNIPFLIGETAFHHQGDITFLNQLINEGIKAGVDTLKFHLLFNLDDYFVRDHAAYDALLELQISESDWEVIHRSLQVKGIKPIYLCNDVESLRWVNSLPENSVSAVEIHATGINDIFLLSEAVKFDGDVMIGVGGSTLEEIHFAVDFLKTRNKFNIILMHGFQNYPTDYKDILFSKMDLLSDIFKLPIGYADHTDPKNDLNEYISCLPQSSGYTILEKHFTFEENIKRIDSQAAVNISTLKSIRKLMNLVSKTYGNDSLKMTVSEKKYGDTGPMKKAMVANKYIKVGTQIKLEDISYKRTNESVPLKQRDISFIVGSIAVKDINKDTPYAYDNVEYKFLENSVDQFYHKN